MSPQGLMRVEFHLPKRSHRRRQPPPPPQPVPRLARLLALAHKWEGLVRRGEVQSYADIARRRGLTRARVTQIMKLLLLAPRIQEAILDPEGSHSISESTLRDIAREPDWTNQLAMWREPQCRTSAQPR